MKKKLSNIIFVVYILIAIFVTICLLSYNNFKVTEFGKKSLVIIDDDQLEPEFKKGDLVIVDRGSRILTGRKAFFYGAGDRGIEIKLGTVQSTEKVTSSETTYTFEGDKTVSGEYVLGSVDSASIIPKVGGVLGILESKWGFLFIIVFPALIAFINQIVKIFTEVRSGSKDEKEN